MKITLIKGDITKLAVDAIVNAANSSLMGGGGVDGAIHKAGGPQILKECKAIVEKQGECQTGDAVITNGGDLPAKYVIHTVGPIWRGGTNNEVNLLRQAYRNVMILAEKHDINTLALPNISTGVYSFPKEKAAKIAFQTVKNFEAIKVKEIFFICFDDKNYSLYQDLMNE